MPSNRTFKIIGLFLLVTFLGACSRVSEYNVLPAGQHKVQVRFTAKSLDGLGAQYTFSRQTGNNLPEQLGAGSARNNDTEVLDGGIRNSGDVIFVEISFRAITPSSTVVPNPAASYAVEILVDDVVQTKVVIDASSKINNTYYLAAVAKTTL
ncbi:hypothetical protein E4631_06620 [Hymenobacter sp. UV11]|uniref:hypothetical protein n=1 Tax=Hymenobacter sp. UV11 TaxID=1849735 RepID=UPI001060E685|nr:hypothetical protein [Hymenobacter sp. UV11]TDN38180.1 hypothetical protein A8B98_24520 [Hymenobacter sp. UV11]TFZ67647.1 hypothetical protein E4631_06620 [Hymenobacter sp. UV11]